MSRARSLILMFLDCSCLPLSFEEHLLFSLKNLDLSGYMVSVSCYLGKFWREYTSISP